MDHHTGTPCTKNMPWLQQRQMLNPTNYLILGHFEGMSSHHHILLRTTMGPRALVTLGTLKVLGALHLLDQSTRIIKT